MSGRNKFDRLRTELAERPGGADALRQAKGQLLSALALSALREARGTTQVELAESIGVSQPNVSRIEHQEDIHLSTLNTYVEALGGRLELRAVFDDETIVLSQS